MDVVVVESPAKAKTINKYLGKDFRVVASMGHVRDLPSKEGSVKPDQGFAMTYESDERGQKSLREIANALKGARHLYLATDPDREGEAISWHVLSALKERGAIGTIDVKRVVFNQITKRAVVDAIAHPRDIDMSLVNAQQARRALDYLVGFSLSPVLWRKLPGSRSAGRVQSVALRLVCERETEIEAFRAREYWSVAVTFAKNDGAQFPARLVALAGKKLDKFDLGDRAAADAAVAAIRAGTDFMIGEVERKDTFRNPPAPFTTSTLQQEASRQLRMRPYRTMQVAQRLYEGVDLDGETVGLITYMRTDGVQIASEAIDQARAMIARDHGERYLPERPRAYRTAAKNAQEAHEAIRPTDVGRKPNEIRRALDPEQADLYELIWKRTVASQMASAVIERVAAEIAPVGAACALRATGSTTKFDGFLALYHEGRDDPADEEDTTLPPLQTGERVAVRDVDAAQHFTEPPPRYTEATLVKKLEELGIGRPSTYASILQVLQDRDYVRLDRGRFFPEDRGRLVTAFLVGFFERYVEYSFTADLEAQLDEVSAGTIDWIDLLKRFWSEFKPAIDGIGGLKVRDVLEALNKILGPHVFPDKGDGTDPRKCPSCANGTLSLKVGRFGAFVGCSNYPECRLTRQLTPGESGAPASEGPVELGKDPASGLAVSLRKGPYGRYVQRDAVAADEKPKRVAVPKEMAIEAVDLERALALLSLPREVGKHPESGKAITAGIGRFGPFLRHDGVYASLKGDDDVLTIGLNRAVSILAEPRTGRGGRPRQQALKSLGPHPQGGGEIRVLQGRYGPYVNHGKVNATLPNEIEPTAVTLDQAIELLAARAAKAGGGRARKPAAPAARPRKTKAKAKGKRAAAAVASE
ncbi:MAG: type I DNA topoisomerase [Alphaproteobacteria bacterium]|nr:type I DNA topoisomerase [Alphaproteobacteria bacterium]